MLLVALVACAVYANSLDGALVFDDTNAIVRNAAVRDGNVATIFARPSWWAEGHGRGWRPVTTLSFALNHALHGLSPRGYHVANVALHAGASALILAVLTRVTGDPVLSTVAALLFAAHPIHTEAVASVVGRAELLAAAGFFLAWLLFLRADTGRHVRPFESVAVVVFFAAMLAKENAVTLLPLLILCDLLYPGAAGTGPLAVRAHARRYLALAVAAIVFVLLRASVIGPNPPGIDRLDNPLVVLPIGERMLTASKVVGLYAWRLLVPLRLAADYSFEQIAPARSPLDGGFLGGLAVLVAVPALAWWARKKTPALALGAGMLVLTFSLVSNLVFPIGTIMAERLLYLPSAGFCLMMAVVLMSLARVRKTAPKSRRPVVGRTPPPAARATLAAAFPARLALPVAVLIVLYGVRTWSRNVVWRDPLTFFTTMVADAPLSARSHRELGNVLAAAGRVDEARRAFERSLAIKPGDAATLYNLGNALSQAARYDEAVRVYEQALAAKPDFVDAIANLGNAESMRGNQQAALRWMRRALELSPRSATLHMNLANTLFRVGANEEAQGEYAAALRLAPGDPSVLTNYGIFLSAQGEDDAAIPVLERAASAPNPMTMVGLAAAYRAKGRHAEARAVQARAERMFPGNAAVRQMGELLRREAAAGAMPAS